MAQGNGKKGITIAAVEVRNFRRLTFAQAKIDKQKGLVRVTGKNRAGKTSLLNAISAVLGGAKAIKDPENTIHEGAEESSYARLELTNGFALERKFTPASPKGYLTVTAADGGRHGQGKLDDWMGALSFDPLAFFELDDKKRAQVLLSLSDNVRLPGLLEAARTERKRLYEERTPWNVEARNAKAVPLPEGERPEPVNLTEDMGYLQKFQAEQRQRETTERLLADARRERGQYQAQVARKDEEIERLEEQLARARNDRKALQESIGDTEGEIATLEAALKELPDRTEEIKAVHEHIAEADAINEALEPWKEYDRAQERIEEATAKARELTEEIEKIDREINELVAGAGIPVPDLSFDDEGLPLIGGRTFSAASGAEKIRTAVAVALAASPDLRVCLLDEANDLDMDALEELDRLASEHEFQVWAVRIGLEGPGEVVVEDGVARERETATV